ncbi:MAG: hypothetical protein ACAI43_10290 [Phycisphaerae bacterium]|nr:hypothetical protein [Tepidisphaeraceae bacterium]
MLSPVTSQVRPNLPKPTLPTGGNSGTATNTPVNGADGTVKPAGQSAIQSAVQSAAQSATQVIRAKIADVGLTYTFGEPKTGDGVKAPLNPGLLGGKQTGGAPAPSTATPIGGIAVVLDPSKRPDLATLPGGNALKGLVQTGLAGLAGQFGAGNRLPSTDVIGSAGATDSLPKTSGERLAGITGFVTAEANAATNGTAPSGDRRGWYMADPTAGSGDTKKDEPKKDMGDKIKDGAKAVVEFLADVVIERFGPPGPAKNLLDGPGFVEKVTGDSKDLLNGFKAIGQSGDKNPDMPDSDGTKTGDPNADVKAPTAKLQKVIDLIASVGSGPARATLGQIGNGLVGQPGDGGSPINKNREVPQKGGYRPSTGGNPEVINPGSNDDGSNTNTGGTKGGLDTYLGRRPGVKDPSKPGSDGLTGPTPPAPDPNANPTGPAPTNPVAD